MKKIFLLASIVVGLCSPALALQAGGGGGDHAGNGGDICEKRIQNINSDFQTWLLNGGGYGLDFPGSLNLETYRSKMLHYIRNSKITCVAEKIYIGRAEKTCKNIIDHSGTPRITCNDERFLKLNSNDQYVLMHHEFAGLSGFEVNTGETSEYRLSNQISEYLRDVPTKKLSVRSPAWDLIDPFDPKSCVGKPFTSATLKEKNISIPAVSEDGGMYSRLEWTQLGISTRERRCSSVRGCNGWTTTPNQYSIDGYLMPTPERAQIVFEKQSNGIAIHFETLRDENKFGVSVDCDLLSKFNGQCIVYSSHTNSTATAKATFNEHCARVVILQSEELKSSPDEKIWIDREIAFGGKY